MHDRQTTEWNTKSIVPDFELGLRGRANRNMRKEINTLSSEFLGLVEETLIKSK